MPFATRFLRRCCLAVLLGACLTATAADNVASFHDEILNHPEIVVMDNDLVYRVLTPGPGTGPVPTEADKVVVKYSGWLIDGKLIDSSDSRPDGTVEVPVNAVITGWREGLQLMRPGDKYRFYLVSEKAYGDKARGQIPANSNLVFDVELVRVVGR